MIDLLVKLLSKIGAIENVVYTEDHDGDVRLRIAHLTKFGIYVVSKLDFCGSCILRPDGNIDNSYVTNWKPYRIGEQMKAWMRDAKTPSAE